MSDVTPQRLREIAELLRQAYADQAARDIEELADRLEIINRTFNEMLGELQLKCEEADDCQGPPVLFGGYGEGSWKEADDGRD